MAFVTIVAAKQMEKGGDIIAKVIAVSDIKEGTTEKGPWRKQEATLKDNSGEVKLTMWSDDVGAIDQGQHYKFEQLFWKEYKDELQPSIGKFTKLSLASPENMLVVTEAEREATPEPPTEASPDDITALPKLPEQVADVIQKQAIELLQIEENVFQVLKKYRPHECKNGQKIGMMVRTIHGFLHDSKVSS